jgi:K+ transporter
VNQLGTARGGAHARRHLQELDALAYAFGMAVTGTITITTLLFFYIVRYHWRQPLWVVALEVLTQ